MSELAYNSNGDTYDVPAKVTGWRVRRLKPRGAPEVVYGRDGVPLWIPIESDLDDLRRAVESPGKYRLDPVDDERKLVDGVPAAYIQVVAQPPEEIRTVPAPTPAIGNGDDLIGVMREALRMNTELARTVVVQFPTMMQAAAVLIQAADGAGIPARPPLVLAQGVTEEDEDEEEDAEESEDGGEATPERAGLDINALIAQVVPAVVMGLMSGKLDLSKLGELLDWRKAAAAGGSSKATPPKPSTAPRKHAPEPMPATGGAMTTSPADNTTALPPLDPSAMAHFIAIQSVLTKEEAALAREVAKDLSPAELRTWFEELKALSVPEAVEKIRTLIGSADQRAEGSAS